MECCDDKLYPYHEKELKSLSRISGQLVGIKKMIEERKYCVDIITQLRAARQAMKAVEANILETYLKTCVEDSFRKGSKKDQNNKISELKDIFKRFE